jgi:hypothetical protein
MEQSATEARTCLETNDAPHRDGWRAEQTAAVVSAGPALIPPSWRDRRRQFKAHPKDVRHPVHSRPRIPFDDASVPASWHSR